MYGDSKASFFSAPPPGVGEPACWGKRQRGPAEFQGTGATFERSVRGQPAQDSGGSYPSGRSPHPTPSTRACATSGARRTFGKDVGTSPPKLQTILAFSMLCSTWAVPRLLNQSPREIFTGSSFTLEITAGRGESSRVRGGKGAGKFPPANSSPPGLSSLPGEGRAGARVGEALEGFPPFSPPAALSYSLSFGASARPPHAWGRAEGPREERGRAGSLRAAPQSRAGGPGHQGGARPHPGGTARRARWVPRPRGWLRGLRRALPLCPPPRPVAPPRRTPEARGAQGRARAGAAPAPPPCPGGGAREAVTSRGARWQHLPAR